MRTFELHRDTDETGVSGTGIVAEVVEFDDGTCALRWMTECRSTAVYASIGDVEKIHGHGGQTRLVGTGDPFNRGMLDCYQDRCENCAFASIGGLERRGDMVAPKYITPRERESYLAGYRLQARLLWGDDWQTCEFGWAPAITIGGAS